MYNLLLDELDYFSLSILWPEQIDEYVYKASLNILELEEMAKNIRTIIQGIMTPYKVYVDSPEKPENFKSKLLFALKDVVKDSTTLIVENRADDKFRIVGASSILAKELRDSIIELLKKQYGDFGSGYPSDPKTKSYIKNNLEYLDKGIVRKSWKTYSERKNKLF